MRQAAQPLDTEVAAGHLREYVSQMESLFGPTTLAGVRALVVEDEPDSRELLSEFLTTCGTELRAAASGGAGFELFTSFKPTIIISDIQMPGEDGFWLIRRVRALPPEEGGLTPAIALSGGTTAEEALGAGFHVLITKPFDPMVLMDVVRDFAKGSPPGRASWTLEKEGDEVTLAWVGHVAGADTRSAIVALVELLEANGPCKVVADLSQLTGFDPSAAYVAESSVWRVRQKIAHVTVLGGSTLARLASKAACTVLGIRCTLA